MKKNKLIVIITIIVSYFNISINNAQSLSLSFNLTETDYLADMIAESKKYNIESLTLSGYVNEENTKFIIDLNEKGTLKELILSGVSKLQTYYKTETKTTVFSGPKGYYIDDSVRKYLSSLYYPNYLFVYSWENEITISYYDVYNDSYIVRHFHIDKRDEIIDQDVFIDYSITNPRIVFQRCSFKKLILPNNENCIGGLDCTYRVKKCDEYILGNKVEIIGDNAFMDSQIGTLVVNSTINEIKTSAFENTIGNILDDPTIFESVQTIGDYAFRNSNLIKNTDKKVSLKTKHIGKGAFLNAIIPNSIILSDIEEMRDSVFVGTSIKDIEVGDKINTINTRTFFNCSNLQAFSGGNNIKSIGSEAFSGCKNLISFSPSVALTTIGKEAFANDSALTIFSIPDATKEIGYGALKNSGIRELHLGIYGDFRHDIIVGCDSLEAYSVSDSNEKLKAEEGVLFSKDGSKIIAYPCAKNNAAYKVDNKVIEIADSTFYCARNLNALTIPESVEKVGYNAFANSGIKKVEVLPTIPPKVSDGNSGLNQSLVSLYVYGKDFDTYYVANYWGDFKYIYTVEKYKLTYLIDGDVYKILELHAGMLINQIEIPTKEGYTFSGWSDIPEKMPAHDVNVTGTFAINKYKLVYQVDGEEYKSSEVEYGASITPVTAPKKEGYTFSGWSGIPARMPAHDVTITGTFNVNQYTITYMIDDEVYQTESVDYGSIITPPSAPVREGYNFEWTDVPETMPAHDIIIVGSYTSGINAIKADDEEGKWYTLDGKQIEQPRKGLNIVRMSNGKTKKVLVQ